MIIGNYDIDETGKLKCLTCSERSWSGAHRCWVPVDPTSQDPYREGIYVMVTAPEFATTVARILYTAWSAEWEKLNTSS